jgi:hypothetical protein
MPRAKKKESLGDRNDDWGIPQTSYGQRGRSGWATATATATTTGDSKNMLRAKKKKWLGDRSHDCDDDWGLPQNATG